MRQVILLLCVILIAGCILSNDDKDKEKEYVPTGPPEKPENFTADTSVANEITLHWTDVKGEDGYILQWCNGGDCAIADTLAKNVVTYKLTELEEFDKYSFFLWSFNGYGKCEMPAYMEDCEAPAEYPAMYRVTTLKISYYRYSSSLGRNDYTTVDCTPKGYVKLYRDYVDCKIEYRVEGIDRLKVGRASRNDIYHLYPASLLYSANDGPYKINAWCSRVYDEDMLQ